MEEQETREKSTPKRSEGNGSLRKAIIVFVTTLVVLAGGGFGAFRAGLLDSLFANNSGNENAQSDSVAIVNNENIMRANFEDRLAQETAQYQQQGIDVTTPENIQQIQNQVMQTMVNEMLLVQNANAVGITPTESEINDRYSSIAEQYGGMDKLSEILNQQGIAQDQVQSDIRRQLTIEHYLATQVDTSGVTVSDEEARATYDQAIIRQTDVPPYEEVVENIKQQVQQRKQDQLVSDFILMLREKSAIEVLL
ncbi:hypothetical protein BK004_02605 [bacterium CG10_46_32]|nr:MAG: hypothetical protein BK004_02605 [bacterium CG10_46_32]PIR56092.1 MAG: hypothetical protein COU73_02630 [Parcubacteria group bacterium CG10_big_fil_rev_8_21_14_0_10_46_32]